MKVGAILLHELPHPHPSEFLAEYLMNIVSKNQIYPERFGIIRDTQKNEQQVLKVIMKEIKGDKSTIGITRIYIYCLLCSILWYHHYFIIRLCVYESVVDSVGIGMLYAPLLTPLEYLEYC